VCDENFRIFFFQKKLSGLEHVLFLKVSFASYFQKRLSKENFCVSLPLPHDTRRLLLRNFLQQEKSVRTHAKMQLQQNAQQI